MPVGALGIFGQILGFVQNQQGLSAQERLEQIKALAQIMVGFQQATTPDYAKVSPWVNTLVALMRPGLTVAVFIAYLVTKDPAMLSLTKLSVGMWFGSRGVEKVAERIAPFLGGGNGNSGNGRNGNGGGH